MRFISNKTKLLKEGMAANPLDHSINNDKDITKIAQEAILTAVAAETDAINQYTQILDLVFESEDWLKKLVNDQIEDIINEEKKHLAQLSKMVSEFPAMSKKWKEGTEEVESGKDVSESSNLKESKSESFNENVPNERTYDAEDIAQLIASKYQLTDEQYWDIKNIFDPENKDELTAEEVDAGLINFAKNYEFSNEEIEDLENDIVFKTKDPSNERREEFQTDMDFDTSTLEDIIDDLHTFAAKQRIKNVVNELREIKYNGEKNVAWNSSDYDVNKHSGGLIK